MPCLKQWTSVNCPAVITLAISSGFVPMDSLKSPIKMMSWFDVLSCLTRALRSLMNIFLGFGSCVPSIRIMRTCCEYVVRAPWSPFSCTTWYAQIIVMARPSRPMSSTWIHRPYLSRVCFLTRPAKLPVIPSKVPPGFQGRFHSSSLLQVNILQWSQTRHLASCICRCTCWFLQCICVSTMPNISTSMFCNCRNISVASVPASCGRMPLTFWK